MTSSSDPVISTDSVAAAKLQILGLAEIKARLGPRWDRLSDLVHRYMRAAIRKVQGPQDYFVVLDELSYAVTFTRLSMDDSHLVCTAIAREVCEILFGRDIDDAVVRSVVARIPTPPADDGGAHLDAAIEAHGSERLTRAAKGAVARPDAILHFRQCLTAHDCDARLFPLWDLRRDSSNSLILAPCPADDPAREGMVHLSDHALEEIELAGLCAAEQIAQDMHRRGEVCAIGTALSYRSMNSFGARIRATAALERMQFYAENPLRLTIADIPEGAPEVTIGELAALLRRPWVRVEAHFRSFRAFSGLGLRLGVIGFGINLPQDQPAWVCEAGIGELARMAAHQNGYAFVQEVNTARQLALVRGQVRFARGTALGDGFSLSERLPHFPLTRPLASPARRPYRPDLGFGSPMAGMH